MDIAGPRPHEIAAPPPWMVVKGNVDKGAFVRSMLKANPDTTVEEIVETLAKRNISVNGMFVARIKQQMAGRSERAAGAEASDRISPLEVR